MSKTLIISDDFLFVETIKRFTKQSSSNFVFANETILDIYNEFIGICKLHDIENIIFFENSTFSEENFILQQKRYLNIYDALNFFKMKKFISYIDFNKINLKSKKVYKEEEIFDDSNQIFNINKKFLLKNNEIINNLQATKCVSIAHGELYGRESNNSIISSYVQKFELAKENNSQVEIIENANNEYQLTFIDNIVDISLYILFENEKLNKINNLFWNIASPEIIKTKDIIHEISKYYKNVKILFENNSEVELQNFLNTEKFILDFVQYPYIKFEEALKIILTN